MLDFSNAPDQREFGNGPVPAGSIVIVQMEVLQPHESKQAQDNPYISVAQSGLRQIYCQFSVTKGSYSGVSFRQNITLPLGGQNMRLTANQEKACNIGSATLKAICLAAKKQPKINDVTSLTGLSFPVRVKINDRPTEKDGRVYWNNEISLVITPDKEAYAEVMREGEIIHADGPVTGDASRAQGSSNSQRQQRRPVDDDLGPAFPSGGSNFGDVPF